MEKRVLDILRRPAIKAGMGNWTYYISTLTYKQLANYVKMPNEVYESKDDSERVQRQLDDGHVQSIKDYLTKVEDRFFDAIVLAVKGGKPRWYPGVFEKDGESYYSIGIVELSGEEGIFPIDGQHRLMAIKGVADEIDESEQEEVPVIMITHGEKNKDTEKMRRLFTSLNRYAKPINPSDYIALDEDDISAIATRYIADNMECFKGKILYSKAEGINRGDKDHFINIISLYKCNDYLLTIPKGKSKTEYKKYRPKDVEIEAFQEKLKLFWEKFIEKNPDVKAFFHDGDVTNLRGDDGGNLLFRPRGIDPYVEAVAFIHKKRPELDYDVIMEKMSNINMDLNSNIWRDILWSGTILQPGQALMRDLFVWLFDSTLLKEKRRKSILKQVCERKGLNENEMKKILEEESL